MIHELLSYGADNARTGKDLARLLGCDIRTITEQIERERRAGQPICANMSGPNAGYYLAETEEELAEYCERLGRRADELQATRQALLEVLRQVAEKKAQEEVLTDGKEETDSCK